MRSIYSTGKIVHNACQSVRLPSCPASR